MYRYAPNTLRWLDSLGLCGEPVKAGEGESFKDLSARGVTGDKLTPHHIPQDALGFTARSDGGAIMMAQSEHYLTRTYGYKGAITKAQDASLSFRQVPARDIRDVRSIVGSKYDEGLKEVINYYRTSFPDLMRK